MLSSLLSTLASQARLPNNSSIGSLGCMGRDIFSAGSVFKQEVEMLL